MASRGMRGVRGFRDWGPPRVVWLIGFPGVRGFKRTGGLGRFRGFWGLKDVLGLKQGFQGLGVRV